MSDEPTIHLAWGANGAAIDVPEEATHWRVRVIPSKGGNPKVLRRGGLPLVIPITANVEALREAVEGKPGLYRLDPCDDIGRDIDGADFAVIEIEASEEDAPDDAPTPASEAPTTALAEMVKTNGELLKTNRDMANALVTALANMSAQAQIAPILEASAALLTAADGAGLPRRAPSRALVRAVDATPPATPPPQPSPLDRVLTMLAPIAPQLGALLMAKLSGDPDVAAAARAQHSAPPPEPPPAHAEDDQAEDDYDDPDEAHDEDDHDQAPEEEAPPVEVRPPNGTNGTNGHHARR